MAEKYTLNWHTFSEHLHLMFKDLYQEGRYSDVTLVSDDQNQFKAHKIVLSACSPVFKKIIDSNPSQHPLIYLRGIQSYEMESILQFMYLGEGKLYQERMGEFIKVTKDLEVIYMGKGVEMPGEKEDIIEDDVPKNDIEGTLQEEQKREVQKPRTRSATSEISTDTKSFECPECGSEFATNPNMLRHLRSIHEGITYPCNQCDYQATARGHLKTHIESKHQGIRYPCNQCDYQASYKTDLHRHIQSVHDGIRYPCSECDYQATERSTLKYHMIAKHSDTIMKCDSCAYQTKWRQSYLAHIKTHRKKH